jgi:hypothetical protein
MGIIFCTIGKYMDGFLFTDCFGGFALGMLVSAGLSAGSQILLPEDTELLANAFAGAKMD